mmetsp:Transcript_150871/g.274578  ORF Transcript_150871/g.274578 Transcript_150871/m.274578 type:complete len:250 (+) Transcript_150871:126-875(+)
MPKVPSAAPFCPSAEVVAQQSVNVTVLKPFSKAVRIVDSTQQFVRKPHRATVSMPLFTSNSSKSVPGNASKPFLPFTMRSPSCGFIASQNSAFHVPSVKSLSLLHPARIPRFLFGLSEPSSLKMMGASITLAPFSRAALHTSAVLLSIFVSAMTSLTAGYNLPPSDANSFWYSMHTTAVFLGSIWEPPFASPGTKTRAFTAPTSRIHACNFWRASSGIPFSTFFRSSSDATCTAAVTPAEALPMIHKRL